METTSVRYQTTRALRIVALVCVLAALAMLTGCGESARAGDAEGAQSENSQAAAEKDADGRTDSGPSHEQKSQEHPEEVEVRAGDGARAGNASAGVGDAAPDVSEKVENAIEKARGRAENSSGGGSLDAKEVALKIRGDGSAEFAGRCSVGDEERRIEGEAPAEYTFETGGKKLACDVRGMGPDALTVVLEVGDRVRSVQQSGGSDGEIRLTYSEDRISVSQSSSGSGNQIQSSSISDVSSRVAHAR